MHFKELRSTDQCKVIILTTMNAACDSCDHFKFSDLIQPYISLYIHFRNIHNVDELGLKRFNIYYHITLMVSELFYTGF